MRADVDTSRLVVRLPGDIGVAELEGTVAELRQLAHGVRPSRLDDGLVPALEAVRATTPIAMDLDVSPLPALDDVRALSAYLVVSEAVTNSLKHAHATRVAVSCTSPSSTPP